jgi:hypothetical protein
VNRPGAGNRSAVPTNKLKAKPHLEADHAVGANGKVFISYGHSVEVSSNQGTSWVVSDDVSPGYGNRLVADALGNIHNGGAAPLSTDAWVGQIRTLPGQLQWVEAIDVKLPH